LLFANAQACTNYLHGHSGTQHLPRREFKIAPVVVIVGSQHEIVPTWESPNGLAGNWFPDFKLIFNASKHGRLPVS
jgi:hypothetical protein